MNAPPDIHLEDLPETAVRITRLIGWDKASALFRELGGLQWQFVEPERDLGSRRFARLEEIVGHDAAAILTREYRSEWIVIPNCKIAFARARARTTAQAFQRDFDAGMTVPEIAMKYGYSYRWVEQCLKRDTATTTETMPQLGLFQE